ncbi:VOC family protein [Longispora albida]|uniref:VOC family protein n=1 Tax=Longispora albida TaxID=203523 RepID=UPI0004768E0A|nr:VOC family protein [Longispora albida]
MAETYQPGAPMWVDIGSTDVPGAIAFYGGLFGWEAEDLGPDAGGYLLFRQKGKQVAGLGPATDPDRGTSWATYFATDDVDETTARVEANGGKVIVPPMDVMDQGRMAVYTDPAGVFFSAWQPGVHKGAELAGEHGTLGWAELLTPDVAGAKTFYSAVLGVSTRDVPMNDQGALYTLLETGGSSVAGAMPLTPDMGDTRPAWNIYFVVDDVDVSADRAVELGATELVRMDSEAGRLAWLIDPQGGGFCVIKPNPDYAP